MGHKHNIVKKPWGYEYLAYENDEVALWCLYIQKGHNTSMHCHPNKTTGLILLDGNAEVSFLSNKFKLDPLNKIMIRKGLFHSTMATGERGAWVLEIEAPVDKHDLVRFKDSYGREGKPYENSTFEYPKEEACLWIEDSTDSEPRTYHIANSELTVTKIDDISFFDKVKQDTNIMFLQGGIVTEYNINVAGAGDIVAANNISDLTKVFNKIKNNTMVMVMDKNV
jgi:mannose-6-phosphate isomerase-like protein (cupin superfamily)